MKIRFYFIGILITFSQLVQAQSGKVAGQIKDDDFNEAMPFANVAIKGTTIGTTSDFEGNYEFQVDPGTYTLLFSFVGYKTLEVTDVKVQGGEVTELSVSLKSESAQLEAVVITAKQARNTESSIINMQKKSANLLDGISSQGLSKTGAGNAAAAVKSIPGVSVQGDKYVYVRGLGDRYTKSILNGVDIPGLDPDRNTIQMDIFPTGIIDNVQVIKSFTADLPADFTGGVVNIVTKDFPTKALFGFSFSTGYNPDMHFNSDFLTADGSKTDFLGFDDGFRKLPIDRNLDIPAPNSSDGLELTNITNQFNPNLSAHKKSNLMNFGLSFSGGNQYDVGENKKIGFLASLSYKNDSKFYKDYETGTYLREEESSVFELNQDKKFLGDVGEKNILLSGLAGVAYKTAKGKYMINALHIQNGESVAGYLRKNTFISNAKTDLQDNIEYTQRSITNVIFHGSQSFNEAKWKVDLKLSPTWSSIQDKDIRLTPFEEIEDGLYSIGSTNPPRRIWRELKEKNYVGKLDVEEKHKVLSFDSKLKLGLSYTYKQRNFGIDNYNIKIYNGGSQEYNAIADNIYHNIWNPETDQGAYIQGNFEIVNTYDATQQVMAAYISEEFKMSENIKGIIGVRAEKFMVNYTGQDNPIPEFATIYEDERIIDKIDLFPSVNLIYSLNENSKIRLSYSRTTARPSFKEASIAKIFDPLTDRYFLGNIDIKPSYINNIDLRFENYGDVKDMFAISGFYKSFIDPIELSIYNASNPTNYTPRNVKSGTVFGSEIEFRRGLEFITLNNFSVIINASVIKSIQKMDKSPGGEYESRVQNARDGEEIKDTRQLQGQSPYLINVGLSYQNVAGDIQSNLFYNTQGETLQVVGIGSVPDVYTKPFHSLNFNISKRLGNDNKSKLKLQVSNLLNDRKESVFKSYKAKDQFYESKFQGRTFSLSYSYTF